VPETVVDNECLREWLKTYVNGVPQNSTAQTELIDRLLDLYPDEPELGSPFGTGNETFGRPAVHKRAAAIFGDFLFQSSKRE
jgi:acetylcholinesterase